MSEPTNIDRAIAFARGDSHQQLAELSPRDKDIAELGARRAIAFLERECPEVFTNKDTSHGNR